MALPTKTRSSIEADCAGLHWASLGRSAARCLLYLTLLNIGAWFFLSIGAACLIVRETLRRGEDNIFDAIYMSGVTAIGTGFFLPLVVIPIFVTSSSLQGAALFLFARRASLSNTSALLISTTMLGLMSFMCYDYLVAPLICLPNNNGLCWTHGFTKIRVSIFMSMQGLFAAFSLWRFKETGLLQSRRASA